MAEKKSRKGACLVRTVVILLAIGVLAWVGNAIYAFVTRVPTRDVDQKVVIIGLDGAYYEFIQEFMDDGRLPNFEKLAKQGVFTRLGTSNPPESPVAWSTFAISANPGEHGIYDFLRKRSREDPWPDLAGAKPIPPKFWNEWLPIRMPEVINMRMGETFWGLAANDGLRVIALATAVTFPPEELPNGYMLSGLNVPDIRGTQATFTFLTSDWERVESVDTEMGGKIIELEKNGDFYEANIIGPWNPIIQSYKYERDQLTKEAQALPPGPEADEMDARIDQIKERISQLEQEKPELLLPVKFRKVDSETVEMVLPDKTIRLTKGEWSNWQEVSFDVTSLVSIHGIMKITLLETDPHIEVYCTPIDFDPDSPPLAITHPSDLSSDLVKALDRKYKTRGWAAETAGLKEKYLPEELFMEDMHEIMDNREAMTLHMMDNYDWDLLVSIFSSTDRAQHLLWHYKDPNHPIFDAEAARKYGHLIQEVYERMDEMLGKVMERIEKSEEDVTLMVVSDHGFAPFYKGINLNTFLVENGFMTPRGDYGKERTLQDLFGGAEFFMDDKGWVVDWKNTQAYAIGLGQIYLNLKGRERMGSVSQDEYYEVCNAIRDKLLELRDPATGEKVIRDVYIGRKVWSGPYVDSADGQYIAPDLQVGFEEGYRVSWQTALGGIPGDIVEINEEKWSGDHCSVDQDIVKGIILSNKKLGLNDPDIMDIGTTVLDIFGTERGAAMEGGNIFTGDPGSRRAAETAKSN